MIDAGDFQAVQDNPDATLKLQAHLGVQQGLRGGLWRSLEHMAAHFERGELFISAVWLKAAILGVEAIQMHDALFDGERFDL